MDRCEICGVKCSGNICNNCKSQMETGDVSDIQKRVDEHNPTEYFLIKSICAFYKITDFDFFDTSSRQPGSQARQLYVYSAVRNLSLTPKHCANLIGSTTCYVSSIMSNFDRKFRNPLTRKKFEEILKIK